MMMVENDVADIRRRSGCQEFVARLGVLKHAVFFLQKLHGGEGEVAYFVYPEDKGKRIYLVNTDWTKAGNVKHCRIEADGVSREIDVREGEVAEVVVQGLPAPESGDGEVIENAP